MHSSIRRMVFDKNEYQIKNLGLYLSVFSIPNYLHLSHTEVQCEINQKLISIKSDNDPNTAQVEFMFRSKQALNNPRNLNEQMQFLREHFDDFGWEAQELLKWMPNNADFYFDSAAQVKMNSWTKGRVALIGDAGYCASPLSGQGNNLAMVGAYILAGELDAAKGDYKQAFNRFLSITKRYFPNCSIAQMAGIPRAMKRAAMHSLNSYWLMTRASVRLISFDSCLIA